MRVQRRWSVSLIVGAALLFSLFVFLFLYYYSLYFHSVERFRCFCFWLMTNSPAPVRMAGPAFLHGGNGNLVEESVSCQITHDANSALRRSAGEGSVSVATISSLRLPAGRLRLHHLGRDNVTDSKRNKTKTQVNKGRALLNRKKKKLRQPAA